MDCLNRRRERALICGLPPAAVLDILCELAAQHIGVLMFCGDSDMYQVRLALVFLLAATNALRSRSWCSIGNCISLCHEDASPMCLACLLR